MPVTLYGSPDSGSDAIEMALRAASIPFRRVRAATWEPGPGHDELLTVNPLGQIPTLVLEDGTVMTESAAILIHLGLTVPDAGLLPTDPSARARALRGLVFIAANCYPAVGVDDYPERWTTATSDAATAAVRAAARRRLYRAWDVFADAFGGLDEFLEDGTPGALALLAVVVSRWSGARQHLAQHRGDFHRALERLEGHPRIAPVPGAG